MNLAPICGFQLRLFPSFSRKWSGVEASVASTSLENAKHLKDPV